MDALTQALKKNRQIRAIGIDDAPFDKQANEQVNIAGIICNHTRFEGMLWSSATIDGNDATTVIVRMLQESKFLEQLHMVLLDGIAIGGFNIIDLPLLAERLNLPCLAVMRKLPDLPAIDRALQHFVDYEHRRALIHKAGPIYQIDNFIFQAAACEPYCAAKALSQITDTGKVPEALRLAHLIGAAIVKGESSKRA